MGAGFCSLYLKIHYIDVGYIKVWCELNHIYISRLTQKDSKIMKIVHSDENSNNNMDGNGHGLQRGLTSL